MRISDIKFSAAHSRDLESGLLGFASCVVEGRLRLDGIAVRRSRDGRFILSFPARRDRQDREHPYFSPVDHASRIEIERAILNALPGTAEGRFE